MFQALKRRGYEGEEGFTLIELMVVVLIIAILIAIAIPTFLGARSRAQDKQAQSNIRNALTAEKTWYVDHQAYTTDVTTAGMKGIEPALNWGVSDASTRGVAVNAVGAGVTTGDNGCVILESLSKSGTDFFLLDIAAGTGAGTYYGKNVATPACPAVNTAPSSTTWLSGW